MSNTVRDLKLSDVPVYPEAISRVARKVAPAWPLDKAIAVNPWWYWRDQKVEQVAATLAALGNVSCLMPKAYYRDQWKKTIHPEHLLLAAKTQRVDVSLDNLLAYLHEEEDGVAQWHNMSELLDAQKERVTKMNWRDEIVQQISQFCGLYFRYPEHLQVNESEDDLYRSWLSVTQQDRGLEVLMGEKGLQTILASLPDCPKKLCQDVFSSFGKPETFQAYAQALMMEVYGWASWMSFTAWENVANDKTNTLVEQLLAIRLAWDWVLWQHASKFEIYAPLRRRFLRQFETIPSLIEQHYAKQQKLWIWQAALELSYQQSLGKQLVESKLHKETESPIKLQAVFCIDVRSETMRRALEAQSNQIETFGFAGFFGLPIEFVTHDKHYARPQLPGLLSPQLQAKAIGVDRSEQARLSFSYAKDEAYRNSVANFGLVEMLGIFKAGKLLQRSFWPQASNHPINHLCGNESFILMKDGVPLTVSEQAGIAENILRNMGLINKFAPIVLLLGHGSQCANNPQSAALDCGACGGQTGEVNVKVLAQLLNDQEVRTNLSRLGIDIPEETRFVAGLHNTTTDEIISFGSENNDGEYINWLTKATQAAQEARAESLGLVVDKTLSKCIQRKSREWAEVRPEWGLANNASFIVAPRSLTKTLDLEGRTFLHNYDWRQDTEFKTLELIMTAPMIVTNWINLQYYASTVDNRVYGSGNKLLHNVVGENIGVFEGNGGDLRFGLSMQSLHDGRKWRHTPQRLSVYISAPREAIKKIVETHSVLDELINSKWLYLFQVDANAGTIHQYLDNGGDSWHRTV